MRRYKLMFMSIALVLSMTCNFSSVYAATIERIGTWGDSITAGCGQSPPAGYCAELDILLNAANIPHVFVNRALPGSDCGYTANNAATWLATDNLDMVLLNCGTNNVPNSQSSQDLMAAQWRTIVETVHATPSIKLGISFIGYSNPNNSSAFGTNLPIDEATANDVIYRQWQYEIERPGWANGFAGLADFQRIPSTLTYLDSGGVHSNVLGNKRMALIWYRAMMTAMNWPSINEPCDMWGSRPGYPAPAFTVCEETS